MNGDQIVWQKARFLGKILKNFIKNLTILILSETVTTIFYGHNQIF